MNDQLKRDPSQREVYLNKIAASGLKEFGDGGQEPVAEKWEKALSEGEAGFPCRNVTVALANKDHSHHLFQLMVDNPERVMDGMAVAAFILNAEKQTIYIPEGVTEGADSIIKLAEEREIEVRYGFLDIREEKDSVVHHIQTMLAVSEILSGEYAPGTYLAILAKGEKGPLKKVPFGTKIGDLIEESPESYKGIEIGSCLYGIDVLDRELDDDFPVVDGLITLIHKDRCILDEAEKRLLQDRKVSCGKCVFCREGLIQLHTMMKEITEGKGKPEFTSMMEEIGGAMAFSSLCSVGRRGGDFTLGSLKAFGSEYEDHIRKKKCGASVCASFVSVYIDPGACTGCEECTEVCPVNCIEGKAGYIHMIDEFDCIKCGKCIDTCPSNAIHRTDGRVPKLPSRLTKCGKFNKR